MQISEKEHILGLISKAIGKWESIAAGIGIDKGPHNCALCLEYWYNGCTSCPIELFTESTQCNCTPYNSWMTHMKWKHLNIKHKFALCKECKDIAQREVEFLEEVYQWYFDNF